jgi:Tol biopolymer transport system component
MYPIWSPSGERIAFGTSRNGVDNLYLMPAGGGPEELLLKGAAIPRDWSHDNRFLVYAVAAGTPTMILPMSGDRKPFAYLSGSNANHSQSRISPDGKWLVYYSSESGRNEIYVQNFPVPVAKYQISTEGGINPRWRRDGNEIFYVSLDNKLMAVGVKTTDKTAEVSAPLPLFDVGIGPIGISYGTRQQYDVTADGRRFLVNVPVDRTAETAMTVVSNWLSSVKR